MNKLNATKQLSHKNNIILHVQLSIRLSMRTPHKYTCIMCMRTCSDVCPWHYSTHIMLIMQASTLTVLYVKYDNIKIAGKDHYAKYSLTQRQLDGFGENFKFPIKYFCYAVTYQIAQAISSRSTRTVWTVNKQLVI